MAIELNPLSWLEPELDTVQYELEELKEAIIQTEGRGHFVGPDGEEILKQAAQALLEGRTEEYHEIIRGQ